MLRLRSLSVAMLLLTVHANHTALGQVNTAPATSPAVADTDHFALQVGELLGIKQTDADIVPALEKALDKREDAAIQELADAVLKGPRATVMLEDMLLHLNINEHSTDPYSATPGWKWGSQQRWDKLISTMMSTAYAMQAAEPKRASEIMRAALYLSAMRDYRFDWRQLEEVNYLPLDVDAYIKALPTPPDDPEGLRRVLQGMSGSANKTRKTATDMKELLQLPGHDFEDLQKLVKTRSDIQNLTNRGDFDAIVQIEELASKHPLPQEGLKRVLESLDKSFRQGTPQLAWRSEEITRTWTLLNLVRVNGTKEDQQLVRDLLEKWKKDYPNPHIARWVADALTREGPPPKLSDSVASFEIDENGKMTPTTNPLGPPKPRLPAGLP